MSRKRVTVERSPPLSWSIEEVVVHSAPDRLDLGLVFAAGFALLAPGISLAFGVSPAWLPSSDGLWRAAHLSAFDGLGVGPFTGALATQTLIFVTAILAWRAVARFGPQSGWPLPDLRADAQARDLFDPSRPNVLIYVAKAQRAVRILVAPEIADRISAESVENAAQVILDGLRSGDVANAIRQARPLLGPMP